MTRQSRRRDNVAFRASMRALTKNPAPDGGIARPGALPERNRPIRTGVRRRKRSWKALVRAADAAFSQYIRRRDPISAFSGKPTGCCFHIVSRTKYAVRWDPDNAIGATTGENYEMEFNPHKFISLLIAKRGLPWYEDLVRRSNQITKRSRADMEAIIERFKA